MAIIDDIEVKIVSTRTGKSYSEYVRTDLDSRHKDICIEKCISNDYNAVPPHAKGGGPLTRERWIEAEADAGFEIHLTLKKGFAYRSEGIGFDIDIDGGVCKFSQFEERPPQQRKSRPIETDKTFKVTSVICRRQKDNKFYSAALTLTEITFCDPKNLPGVKLRGTGVIEIDVYRIKQAYDHENPKPIGSSAVVRDGRFDIGVNDERTDMSPTHMFHVGAVNEIQRPNDTELDLDQLTGKYNRHKVFKFFYRSSEALKALGCVVATELKTTSGPTESRGPSPTLSHILDHLTDAEALSEINNLRGNLESEKERNTILTNRLRERDQTAKLERNLGDEMRGTIEEQDDKITAQQDTISDLRTQLTEAKTTKSKEEHEHVKRLSFQLQSVNRQLKKVQGAYDKRKVELKTFQGLAMGVRDLLAPVFHENKEQGVTGTKRKSPTSPVQPPPKKAKTTSLVTENPTDEAAEDTEDTVPAAGRTFGKSTANGSASASAMTAGQQNPFYRNRARTAPTTDTEAPISRAKSMPLKDPAGATVVGGVNSIFGGPFIAPTTPTGTASTFTPAIFTPITDTTPTTANDTTTKDTTSADTAQTLQTTNANTTDSSILTTESVKAKDTGTAIQKTIPTKPTEVTEAEEDGDADAEESESEDEHIIH